jgi:hypothetical protein
MLHVFIGEILANMTQVSDVAPGPLVFVRISSKSKSDLLTWMLIFDPGFGNLKIRLHWSCLSHQEIIFSFLACVFAFHWYPQVYM